MENGATNEPKYRLNLKQNVKGFVYYDLTVRGDTLEEIQEKINELADIAQKKCDELNKGEAE